MNVIDMLTHTRLYPSTLFYRNPFRVYEFGRLMKLAKFKRSDHVLDIGCGAGLLTNIIGRRVSSVTGIDISENDINRARSEQHLVNRRINSRFLLSSIEDAGFEDQRFDAVVSVCVLEHIPDDDSVLQNAYRVLKPGGRMVFSVDCLEGLSDSVARELHRERYHVVHPYTQESLTNKIEAAGFSNIQVYPLMQHPESCRRFEQAIYREFDYRYSEVLLERVKISFREMMCKEGPPIFLLARAEKGKVAGC